MADVIVTGAGGFIGRRLVAMLHADGVEAVGWTRDTVDLRNADAVAAAIDAAAPRLLFHLASSGVSPKRQTEHCVADDTAMAAAIVAALPPGAVLVQAGSMAEYGRAGRLTETDAARPTNIYGRAKLAASRQVIEQGPARGATVTVARIFGAYGPGEAPGRLIPNLVDRLGRGEPIPLSDGLQRRDFVHVDDICRTLIDLAALRTDATARIVNVGTGIAIPVREVCERIADALGADRSLLHFGQFPRRETDEDLLEADIAVLTALLGKAPPQRLLDADAATLRALIGA